MRIRETKIYTKADYQTAYLSKTKQTELLKVKFGNF